MDELVVSTDVYASPTAVYEFLLDFPRYEQYTEYLNRVSRTAGDGGPGSRYAMRFAYWKLTYTARSTVTEVTPPTRIDWKLIKDIDAHGAWKIEPFDELPADAPRDASEGATVTMIVNFDPNSASGDALSLPSMVSFDWVLSKIQGLVEEEAKRVVRRAVLDLEGRDREVTLDVSVDSDVL